MTLGIVALQSVLSLASPLSPVLAQAGGGSSDTSADVPQPFAEIVPPMLIFALCLLAGVGTYLLLPHRRSGSAARGAGGTFVLLAGLTLALLVIKWTATYATGGPGIYFWIFSAVALLGALRVVTHPRPVYAALYFVLTVFATAGLFILLWAEFMAAALVLIYAGAILVTYVFVIMLAASTAQAGIAKLAEYDAVSRDPAIASAVGVALMGVLLFVIFDRARPISTPLHTYTYTGTKAATGGRRVEVSNEVTAPSPAAARALVPDEVVLEPNVNPEPAYNIQALGRYLFREQAVNLELAGLLLTLGMVGAILIARRHVMTPGPDHRPIQPGGRREGMTAPATPISDDPYSIPVYGTENPAQKAYPET